jgi:hypothetical protein
MTRVRQLVEKFLPAVVPTYGKVYYANGHPGSECRRPDRRITEESKLSIGEEKGAVIKQRVMKVKMKKNDFIRVIQEEEGNPACFNTGRSLECGELTCLWRQECRKTEIVRTIQKGEGNTACFNTGRSSECGKQNCLWLHECQ